MVLGASLNKDRYSNKAIRLLREHHHEVIAIGLREGEVSDVSLRTDRPIVKELDTVTLYLGPKNQKPFEQYILDLAPKRVIFNPGTEHLTFQERLQKAGISCEIACTLVLLRTHQFETLLNE